MDDRYCQCRGFRATVGLGQAGGKGGVPSRSLNRSRRYDVPVYGCVDRKPFNGRLGYPDVYGRPWFHHEGVRLAPPPHHSSHDIR